MYKLHKWAILLMIIVTKYMSRTSDNRELIGFAAGWYLNTHFYHSTNIFMGKLSEDVGYVTLDNSSWYELKLWETRYKMHLCKMFRAIFWELLLLEIFFYKSIHSKMCLSSFSSFMPDFEDFLENIYVKSQNK